VLPPGVTPSPELVRALPGNRDSVSALAFSPDGGTVASGAWDSGLRMWDVRTGRPRGVLSPDRPHVKSVAFSPDGRRVAGVTQLFEGREHVGDALGLWDRRTGRLLWSRTETDPGKFHLSSVTFSADGGTLASTGFRVDGVHKDGDTEVLTAMSAVATLREADTGKPRERRAFPRGDFSSAFTPSLEGLVTQERVIENQRLTGCFVRQWDLATGALLRTIPAPAGVQIMRTVVSPDGRLIAGAGQAYRPARPPHGPCILLWDAGTGQLLRTLTDREGSLMHALAFSPDGTLLAGAGDKVVRVWEVGTGRLRRSLVGHGKLVRQVAFSPDGRLLASGDLGGVILLWRLR
jgi:WD40 repeat protein